MTLAQVLSLGQWVQAEARPRAEPPREALPPLNAPSVRTGLALDRLLFSLCALARGPRGLPPCPTQ